MKFRGGGIRSVGAGKSRLSRRGRFQISDSGKPSWRLAQTSGEESSEVRGTLVLDKGLPGRRSAVGDRLRMRWRGKPRVGKGPGRFRIVTGEGITARAARAETCGDTLLDGTEKAHHAGRPGLMDALTRQ